MVRATGRRPPFVGVTPKLAIIHINFSFHALTEEGPGASTPSTMLVVCSHCSSCNSWSGSTPLLGGGEGGGLKLSLLGAWLPSLPSPAPRALCSSWQTLGPRQRACPALPAVGGPCSGLASLFHA